MRSGRGWRCSVVFVAAAGACGGQSTDRDEDGHAAVESRAGSGGSANAGAGSGTGGSGSSDVSMAAGGARGGSDNGASAGREASGHAFSCGNSGLRCAAGQTYCKETVAAGSPTTYTCEPLCAAGDCSCLCEPGADTEACGIPLDDKACPGDSCVCGFAVDDLGLADPKTVKVSCYFDRRPPNACVRTDFDDSVCAALELPPFSYHCVGATPAPGCMEYGPARSCDVEGKAVCCP